MVITEAGGQVVGGTGPGPPTVVALSLGLTGIRLDVAFG